MITREQFYEDFGRYHGVPDDVTITFIDEESREWLGCPTCGGDMEYYVNVYGRYSDNRRYYKNVEGKVSDFINDLD